MKSKGAIKTLLTFIALRGLGAGISAGFGAVVIGITALVFPSRLADDADQPPSLMASGEKGSRLDPLLVQTTDLITPGPCRRVE